MGFVALRVTAFVMILHLSQVTPSLSCTYSKFNGARLTNVMEAFNNANSGVTLEQCFKQCFENSGCISMIFDPENSVCNVFVTGKGVQPLSSYKQPEVYQFDRNVFNTSCPRVKQWLAQQANVAA